MTIKAPSYQKDAIPTRKGWVHPKTGEILVGGSISQRDIDEYLGVIKAEPVSIQEIPVDFLEGLENEADIILEVDDDIDWEIEEIDLDPMTKAELIELAEEWEIEIDTKTTKAEIKKALEELLN